MATFVDATAERDRLMTEYPGVTARIVPGAVSGHAVSIHDARASERKAAGQRALIDNNDPLNEGHVKAWSDGFEPGPIQALYP